MQDDEKKEISFGPGSESPLVDTILLDKREFSRTQIILQYVEMSWNHEFPEYIDAALESFFTEHPKFLTKERLNRVMIILSLDPCPSMDVVIKTIQFNNKNLLNNS